MDNTDVIAINGVARLDLVHNGWTWRHCPICEETQRFRHTYVGTDVQCDGCGSEFQPCFGNGIDGVLRIAMPIGDNLIQYGFAHSLMCDCVTGPTRFEYRNGMGVVQCSYCNRVYHPIFNNE